MTASPLTVSLRKSLAIDSGSPPSESDTANFTLCRRTQRSHANLLAQAALVDGDYVAFLDSLGYDSTANPTYNLDKGYWRMMCYWISAFIPAFEKIMNEIEKLDPEEMQNRMAKHLNMDLEAVKFILENRGQFAPMAEILRPELGAIAELKLGEMILKGDKRAIMFALPFLKPEIYGSNKFTPIPTEQVFKIIHGDDE